MNARHVLSIQLDRLLCAAFERFRAESKTLFGIELSDAEAARMLLRKALDDKTNPIDSGYLEGRRRGAAEAKEAILRNLAAAVRQD